MELRYVYSTSLLHEVLEGCPPHSTTLSPEHPRNNFSHGASMSGTCPSFQLQGQEKLKAWLARGGDAFFSFYEVPAPAGVVVVVVVVVLEGKRRRLWC